MGEEHSTVGSITSSSCHIFLNIILSFIVKPSFSLRLKFEIIKYLSGSIIGLRNRKGAQKQNRQTASPVQQVAVEKEEEASIVQFSPQGGNGTVLASSDAVVPVAGLEPARLAALDFESSTSTNSITPANSAV